MDIEKLIEQLNDFNENHIAVLCRSGQCACGYLCDKDDCIVVRAATALSTLKDENEKLRAELEQVKRERDVAQVTLAETSGLAGGVVQTLFGVPLERMRELAKAELEGRIVLRSAGAGKKCGSCGNFHRIPGTKRGTCAIRQWERNRLGQTEHWRHSFTPSQSYGACRDYIPREDDNHG